MPEAVKLGINCIVAAGLTIACILVFASLPEFTLEPLKWAGREFARPTSMAFWFGYTVLLWSVLAGIVAWCMLALKPRKVVLYGCVSAAAFVIVSRPWLLVPQSIATAYLRELVLVLAVPLLYWAFAHLAGKTDNDSSTTSGGAP